MADPTTNDKNNTATGTAAATQAETSSSGTGPAEATAGTRRALPAWMAELRLVVVLVPLMVVLAFMSPRFLTLDNLTNVVWSICTIGILASGSIYPRITGGIDLSLGSLVALTGVAEPALRERLGEGVSPLPVPAAFVVDAVPLTVLSQRPDIAAAEQALAAAIADIGVAEANRYPRLSLSGNVSLASVLTGASSTSLPWSIGPALSLPIFNGGARAAEVKAAEARREIGRAHV